MRISRRLALAAVAFAALLAGCHDAAPPPAGTGARETAERFFGALVRQDWPAAYAELHPDERRRVGPEEFAEAAKRYRRRIGFEPASAAVRSCDERDDGAIAHVVIAGTAPHSARQFKDAIALHRTAGSWGIILPTGFGRPPRH